MLGKGWAVSELPYEAYTGPLTAGPSSLQEQGFGGIAGLTLPEGYGASANMMGDVYNQAMGMDYDPMGIGTQMWNQQQADHYMSPYIQQALEPQLAEIARQSAIQRLDDTSRLTKAGAYGGSRQAIMDSERNDNMLRLMAELTGKGYQDAYESAGRMFTSDQGRQLEADRASEQSRQFGANLGLGSLGLARDTANSLSNITDRGFQAERDIYGDMLGAGATQRGITSEGIAADYGQWKEEMMWPYKQAQYMQSLLDGLPLGAQQRIYPEESWLSQFGSGAGGIMELYKILTGGEGSGSGPSGGGGDGGIDLNLNLPNPFGNTAPTAPGLPTLTLGGYA
jgi:hypothetical protein